MCAPHLDPFCSTLYRTKYCEPRLAHVLDVYTQAEIQFTITTLERIMCVYFLCHISYVHFLFNALIADRKEFEIIMLVTDKCLYAQTVRSKR